MAPIAKKLAWANTGSNSKEVILYNVPDKLRNVKEDAYCHRVVPIGTMFYKRKQLEYDDLIENKWRYMLHFFQRTRDPAKPDRLKIIECVDAVHVLATKLKNRRGYSGESAQDRSVILQSSCHQMVVSYWNFSTGMTNTN